MSNEPTQFSKHDQSRIYELGRRMNHSSYLDRITAEGELFRFVSELAKTIEARGVHAWRAQRASDTDAQPNPLHIASYISRSADVRSFK